MINKFYKKVIAQRPEDLSIISALCSQAKVKQSDIKYLKNNKVFILTIERTNKESNAKNEKIGSVIKFDFIDNCKSKNINQNDPNILLELLAIDIFKRNNDFEITLLFSKNRFITLTTEVIEVTLEDQKLEHD